MNKSIAKKILLVLALVVIAVSWRIINNNYTIAPNLELVTTVSVIGALILGIKFAILIPFLTMIISDYLIGNSEIFIFTWSAFIIIGISATILRKFNNSPKKQVLYSGGFAIMASFLFFLITNFGVWAQGWYPATLAGLIDCFVLAIPFYRTMLVGNLIFVPSAVVVWQLVRIRMSAKNSIVNTLVSD